MRNRSNIATAIGIVSLAACVVASPAWAGSSVTFVSGKGSDSGSCASPATPCRTFNYAYGKTNADGEIKTLDAGNFSSVSIAKSITITGVPGASIHMTAAGTAITIDNPDAVVSLRGLEINGRGVGTHGVVVASAKAVSIVDCIVRRVGADGISISPSTGAVSATISDTISSNNGNFGVQFVPGAGASVKATVDHTTTNDNGFAGILVSPGATVMIVDSIANNNAVDGFRASGGATSVLRITRSVATGNPTGLDNVTSATVQSYGYNKIFGNGVDKSGTITVMNPPLEAVKKN
jgi:hypothetical protein